MTGCFGNHPIDRWMERQLDRYLDAQECPPQCEECPHVADCDCTPAACKTGDLCDTD